jgi:ribA/ribD-fused uncharacterized protein
MNPPTDLAELQSAVARGKSFRYLNFWGHRQPAGGAVNASCFSQWYPAHFAVDGIAYPTAEHFMMAEKARLFDDKAALQRVLAARSPAEAKAVGRLVTGYDDRRWAARRFDAVVEGNFAKFSQSGPLREYLLASGQRVLVEASPVDRIWGIGLAADDPLAANPQHWRGLNLLGFALMVVRDRLAT